MRWHALMMFGCTPAGTPPAEVPTEPPQSNWVRRLSDIEVHADRITFIDLESSPQRLAALTRAERIDGGSFEAGAVAVAGADHTIAVTRAAFRGCYNKGLQTDPNMQGKAIFGLKIGPDGGQPVSVEQTGGSGLSDGVVACLKRKLEAASFDAPGGSGSTLQVPITFVQQGNPNVKPWSPDAPAGWIDFAGFEHVAAQRPRMDHFSRRTPRSPSTTVTAALTCASIRSTAIRSFSRAPRTSLLGSRGAPRRARSRFGSSSCLEPASAAVLAIGRAQPALQLAIEVGRFRQPHVVHVQISEVLDPSEAFVLQRTRQDEVDVDVLGRQFVHRREADLRHEGHSGFGRRAMIRATSRDHALEKPEEIAGALGLAAQEFGDRVLAARMRQVLRD